MKNLLLLAFLAFTLNAHAQLNKKWTTSQSLSGGIFKTKTCGILASPTQSWWYPWLVSNENFEITEDSIKGVVRNIDTAGNVLWTTTIPQIAKVSSFLLEDEPIVGIPVNNLDGASKDAAYIVVPYNVSPTSSRLIKTDSTGAIVWNIDVANVNRISDWIVDSAGNTYLCGRTPETDSAGIKSNGIAIAKYDLNGQLVWKKTKYNTDYRTVPVDISLDADGRVIVCGKKAAKLYQPQTAYTTSFVTVYDNNGNAVWTKEFSSFTDSVLQGILYDNSHVGADIYGNIWFIDTQYDSQTNIPSVKLRKAAKLTGTVQFTKTISNAELILAFGGQTGEEIIVCTTIGMRCYNLSGTLLWSNNYVVRTGFTDVVIDTLGFFNNGDDNERNDINAMAWPDDWEMPWVIAKNVESTLPLDYYLVQLVDSTGDVLFKKNLSFGGSHDEYLGDYAGLVVDTASNVYLLINDTVPPYGTRVTKLSQCDNTSVVTGSLDITKISGNNCANGKIKVQSLANGTINNWIHIDLYNNSNALIGAVDVPAGTSNYTFQNLNSGKYTVKIYDESCDELVKTGTISCPTPSSGFSATNIQPTSATVNWNDVSCDDGYRVQYRKSGTNTWNYLYVGGNSAVLNNLLPSTVYSWRVASKCINSTPLTYSSVVPQVHSFTTAALKNGNGMPDVIYESMWIEISPNPVNDKMLLSTTDNIKGAVIKIFNSQGQLVLEKKIKALNENEPLEINVQPFSPGIYLLQLQSEGEIVTNRFVKE